MEECKVCGRENPMEGANFCYYCGASFHEDYLAEQLKVIAAKEAQKETQQENQTESGTYTRSSGAKPMSMWRWLALFMLFLIPVYGWILLVIMLFLHAFGSRTTPERKEMAKGLLLFLVVYFLFLVAGMTMLMDDPNFQAMLGSGMGQ